MQIRSDDQIQLGRITLQPLLSKLTCCRYALQCFIITFSITAKPGRGAGPKGFMINLNTPTVSWFFVYLHL